MTLALRNVSGVTGPGYHVQVWDDFAWRESVLAAPRGGIPAVVEGLRRVAEHFGVAGPQHSGLGGWAGQPVQVVEASVGRDLLWVVRTGGAVCCDAVACGVGRAIGAAVTTAPVEAYDPDTNAYAPMVLVRVGAEAGRRLQDVAEQAGAVHVSPCRYPLRPCVYGHPTPPGRRHEAAARASGRRQIGADTFALVVKRTAADAAGQLVSGAGARRACL